MQSQLANWTKVSAHHNRTGWKSLRDSQNNRYGKCGIADRKTTSLRGIIGTCARWCRLTTDDIWELKSCGVRGHRKSVGVWWHLIEVEKGMFEVGASHDC